MRVKDVPGCCTANVLVGVTGAARNFSSFEHDMDNIIRAAAKGGEAVILVQTTSAAKTTNRYLRKYGFKKGGTYKKRVRHTSTELYTWEIGVIETMEKLLDKYGA